MIPGVNPRQLKQMMRQMGMSQEDIEASKVIIKTASKDIIIENPSIQKVTMQGQTTFQVAGDYTEQIATAKIVISQDDIETVVSQANVSKEQAKIALENANGDLAQAIVDLTQ